MSKLMTIAELKAHCAKAVKALSDMLTAFAEGDSYQPQKRAMLIAYWVKTYVEYLRKEDSFSPESVFSLKRGTIVRVEFGYRIGRELGGRHYAVVLDVNNSLHRNTVTVVPLGSVKADSKTNRYNVVLDSGIYGPVSKKINALIEDAKKTLVETDALLAKILDADEEERIALHAVKRQKIADAQALIDRAEDWVDEISHMKQGSVAKLDQITTISKMRISQPLQKTHPLYGVRLTPEDMDKIDLGLRTLYFQPSRHSQDE